jgi:hypothetical protein
MQNTVLRAYVTSGDLIELSTLPTTSTSIPVTTRFTRSYTLNLTKFYLLNMCIGWFNVEPTKWRATMTQQ